MWALWDHRLAHITELKLTGLCHWAVCLSHITAGWMLARCSFLMPLLALHTNNFLAVTDVSSWYSVWENCTILDICLLRFVRFWAVFFVRCVQVMFTKKNKKTGTISRFVLLQAYRAESCPCYIECLFILIKYNKCS